MRASLGKALVSIVTTASPLSVTTDEILASSSILMGHSLLSAATSSSTVAVPPQLLNVKLRVRTIISIASTDAIFFILVEFGLINNNVLFHTAKIH
jgi:hypothetical protein